jgi:hypothetical protein
VRTAQGRDRFVFMDSSFQRLTQYGSAGWDP